MRVRSADDPLPAAPGRPEGGAPRPRGILRAAESRYNSRLVSYEASQSVVEAARRYRPGTEDFLTELLAAALQAHAGFASALCREVGLPTGKRRRARTHVTKRLPEGRWGFIDMELEIRNTEGALVTCIWAEHKTPHYGFRERQLHDYHWALRRQRVPHRRLITIVPASIPVPRSDKRRSPRLSEISDPVDDWATLGWQRIAELAIAATAHLRQRRDGARLNLGEHLLHELVTYLKEHAMASASPVASSHIGGLEIMSETSEAMCALLENAATKIEAATRLKHDGGVDDWEGSDAGICYYQPFGRPRGSWIPTDADSGPALIIGDTWQEQEIDSPFIAAGVWLPATYAEQLEPQSDWVGRVVKSKFKIGPYLDYFLVAQVRPLAEAIANNRSSLDKQGEWLAKWASRALVSVLELQPEAKLRKSGRR